VAMVAIRNLSLSVTWLTGLRLDRRLKTEQHLNNRRGLLRPLRYCRHVPVKI